MLPVIYLRASADSCAILLGRGYFQTSLHPVDCVLGNLSFRIRGGNLPGFLAGMMTLAGAECIIGNEIIWERVIGYFPGRCAVVLIG